jgi:hypothetical protein
MKYEVTLYEKVYHNLIVEADSRNEALELAEELVSNRTPGELEDNNNYTTGGQYTVSYECYELETENN